MAWPAVSDSAPQRLRQRIRPVLLAILRRSGFAIAPISTYAVWGNATVSLRCSLIECAAAAEIASQSSAESTV